VEVLPVQIVPLQVLAGPAFLTAFLMETIILFGWDFRIFTQISTNVKGIAMLILVAASLIFECTNVNLKGSVQHEDLGFAKAILYKSCLKDLKQNGLQGMALHQSCQASNISCALKAVEGPTQSLDCGSVTQALEQNSDLIIDASVKKLCPF